jgi:hypothetical protein
MRGTHITGTERALVQLVNGSQQERLICPEKGGKGLL